MRPIVFVFTAVLLVLVSTHPSKGAAPASTSYPRYPSRRYSPIVSFNLDPQENANTALRIAARHGKLDRMEDALKRGAKVNSRSADGTTALMFAAQGCYTEAVDYLLRLGVSVNLADKRRRTALMLAIRGSCLPVVTVLLEHPLIEFHRKDRNNRSVQDIAASAALLDVDGPSVEILRLLRAKLRQASGVRGQAQFHWQ